MRIPAVLLPLLLVPSLAACKASVNAEVNASASVKGEAAEPAEFDRPLDEAALEKPKAAADATSEPDALLGSRSDLSYAGSTKATCQCLAVAVGGPGDAAFRWAGKPPRVNDESQVVLALTSAGVSCPGAASGGPGASYWGYEVVGDDVVVVVEQASPTRPLASGAILPRPMGSGRIFVRPATSKGPYGRPLSGTGERCELPVAAARPKAAAAPGAGQSLHREEVQVESSRADLP